MSSSHKFAIAAQMHVLLRRKTGRVTDTEWMVENADYAREIVRFARLKAREAGDTGLAEYADKAEKVLLERDQPVAPPALSGPAVAGGPAAPEGLRERPGSQHEDAAAPRYVGGLR